LKRRIAVALLGIVVAVLVAAAFVGIRVRNELIAARSLLSESPASLTTSSIRRADEQLAAALAELNSPPAKLLRFIPLARQNVIALDAVARATRPVLDSAAAIDRVARDIESRGLMDEGKVDLALIHRLEDPLSEELNRLSDLEQAAREHQSGWLVPALWDEIDGLLLTARDLHSDAANAQGLVRVAGPMLGSEGTRTYLIVLMNNAELRGAGGIPSGVGTLTMSDGRLTLGHFDYAPDLRGPRPYTRVKAPSDFRRRYGRFWADRTFWVNTTMSSDVPDVAKVAERLYAVIPGRKTDGVLLADPHGVSALMRSEASIDLPGSKASLTPAELPDYAYSTVYEQEEAGVVDDRHDALLNLGELAFRQILSGGFGSREQMTSMSDAFAAGHLRFVSFHAAEQKMLDAAGATGNIRPPEGDSLFVTAYNTGADKLDYWARRSVAHHCVLSEKGTARCSTSVTLRNVAPEGLPRLVSGRPYGVLSNFLEVYIPERADISFVERDGQGAEYFKDHQDGHAAIGFNVRLEPGDETRVEVGYELGFDDAYTLEVMPQPLTHSARLDLVIELPGGWEAQGPAGSVENRLAYSGTLTRSLSIHAGPASKAGLSALWDGVVHFWNEPLG
jgi:hypothetical protein